MEGKPITNTDSGRSATLDGGQGCVYFVNSEEGGAAAAAKVVVGAA